LVFLDCNSVEISEATEPLYEAMIAIAERRMDKNQLADLLRSLSKNK